MHEEKCLQLKILFDYNLANLDEGQKTLQRLREQGLDANQKLKEQKNKK